MGLVELLLDLLPFTESLLFSRFFSGRLYDYWSCSPRFTPERMVAFWSFACMVPITLKTIVDSLSSLFVF